MCKFPAKILMLTVLALLLNAGAAFADPSSSDWNDSWGFPSPAEKANLLNQALAIEFIENDGFDNDYYSSNFNTQNCNSDGACFTDGDTIAIGSQVIVDVDGDNNNVNGNASTDGNTAAQTNEGSGSIDQSNNDNPYEYIN